MLSHHPVFNKFKRWQGHVPNGYQVNFLGVLTNTLFADWPESPRGIVSPSYPDFDEEYFEWIDLLEAVTEARDHFTMIELGAGWGRWLANGVAAARQYGNIPYQVIGVEAEPNHFEWLKQHLDSNDVDPARRKLIEAAVSRHDGTECFLVGDAQKWYGQSIISPSFRSRLAGVVSKALGYSTNAMWKKVKAISLATLLDPLDSVDLIDLDVQGSELAVLTAVPDQLAKKVKRLHIGTHTQKIEVGLVNFLTPIGFEIRNNYAFGSEAETPYGKIKFQDGVQTWVNPRLLN
ncbi:MAG: methyltransferase FkbM family [Gemmataceae bacterium]|nr:methyltransferase FkbM family [Gemmataceae bacterium]